MTISNEEFTTLANNITSKYIDQSILPSCDYIIKERVTIDYQSADTYKSDWSIWEAIREIIQNSMDTETRVDVYTPNNNTIVIHDEGKGLSIKDFRMGGGEKAKLKDSKNYDKECDPENMVRGAHGEGMKLTFLVLAKNPELYKFCICSRCLRANGEFIESKIFKDPTMNIILEPISPQKGTTFILNAQEQKINELLNYCRTRFIYWNLYINNTKSAHITNDTLSHITGSNKLRAIGQIVNFQLYDSAQKNKPLYIRGIYVQDIETVFSYNFICPSLDSARNVVETSQIKQQIKRVITNLEFNGIKPEEVVEKFVKTLIENYNAEFIERNLYFASDDFSEEVKKIYINVWNTVLGKNAFIQTDLELTKLAMEQPYIEKDEKENIIIESYYKPAKIPDILKEIFISVGVKKDSDIVVQETKDVPCTIEDLRKYNPDPMKNLRDAISVLCPVYKLDMEEELKLWDVFIIEYKTTNQPPKTLWKKWDTLSRDKEKIFDEIDNLYDTFGKYPLIIEKGLNLPILSNPKEFGEIAKMTDWTKQELLSKNPKIAKYIEQFENRRIPISEKYGFYHHGTKRFGIRYDALMDREKTFTVAIHEYAHKLREVEDIADQNSSMGKILTVIQWGYGKILNDVLSHTDNIYKHYILKTIQESITYSTTNEQLKSILSKKLPSNISEIIFAACSNNKSEKTDIIYDTVNEELGKEKSTINNSIKYNSYEIGQIILKASKKYIPKKEQSKKYLMINSLIWENINKNKVIHDFIVNKCNTLALTRIIEALDEYPSEILISNSNFILENSIIRDVALQNEDYVMFKLWLSDLLGTSESKTTTETTTHETPHPKKLPRIPKRKPSIQQTEDEFKKEVEKQFNDIMRTIIMSISNLPNEEMASIIVENISYEELAKNLHKWIYIYNFNDKKIIEGMDDLIKSSNPHSIHYKPETLELLKVWIKDYLIDNLIEKGIVTIGFPEDIKDEYKF